MYWTTTSNNSSHDRIYTGKDDQTGTVVTTTSGRFAAVTNYREKNEPNSAVLESRGALLSQFLEAATNDTSAPAAMSAHEYAQQVESRPGKMYGLRNHLRSSLAAIVPIENISRGRDAARDRRRQESTALGRTFVGVAAAYKCFLTTFNSRQERAEKWRHWHQSAKQMYEMGTGNLLAVLDEE